MVAQLDRATAFAAPRRVLPRLLTYAFFEGRPALTRGRWVNPLVEANLTFAERGGPQRRVLEPVFIVGIGRSGTTLLGQLFGVHSHVGFLNEPKLLWHRIVDDEDLIGSYGREPVQLRLGVADADDAARRRAIRLFGWYLWATRSRRVVDKYPELVYRVDFVRELFPDAHFIIVRRHPWDVVTSITAWGDAKATADADWWGVADRKWRVLWTQGLAADPRWQQVFEAIQPRTATPEVRAAVEWLLGTAEGLEVARRHDDDRVHSVRYEDLLSAPRETMTDLLERCALPVERSVLALAARSVMPRRAPRPAPDLPGVLRRAVEDVAAQAGY